jgi:hypothetical protein
LVVASPGGFASLVTEAGTPDEGSGVPPSAAPDMDLFLRACAELGDELLGSPGALPTDDDRPNFIGREATWLPANEEPDHA